MPTAQQKQKNADFNSFGEKLRNKTEQIKDLKAEIRQQSKKNRRTENLLQQTLDDHNQERLTSEQEKKDLNTQLNTANEDLDKKTSKINGLLAFGRI